MASISRSELLHRSTTSLIDVASFREQLLAGRPNQKHVTLQLQSVSCGGRHDRTMVRFKLQNTTHSTPPAKNLDDHTQHSFSFQTTVHSMAFDTVKIDLYDLKAFGSSHHAGRAYLPLRELQKLVGAKYSSNSCDDGESERSSERINFDAQKFNQEHDDIFEISLPLFKPGSYSKLGSSLHRHSALDIDTKADSPKSDVRKSEDMGYSPDLGLHNNEVGVLTLKATLHFKAHEVNPRLSSESIRSSSSSIIAMQGNESPRSGVHRSNQSVYSFVSHDSMTLGDNHFRAGSLRSSSSYTSLGASVEVNPPSPFSDPESRRPDSLVNSMRGSMITPPLSPLVSSSIQSPDPPTTPSFQANPGYSTPPPQRRLSSWYEWNYVEGFVDENNDEPAEDILTCLRGGNQSDKKDIMNGERDRGIELMADITANGDQARKDQFLSECHNGPSDAKLISQKSGKGLLHFFSKQTRSAFKDIQLIYSSFFKHGWNLTRAEFMKGFHLVEQYYALNPTPKSYVAFDDVELLERAQHFIRLAMASYGSLSWVYFGYSVKVAPLNFIRFNSDRKNVMDYFKLKKEDMIVWHFDKRTALVPSYFIIRDPKYNALCIVLRGTFNVTDFMTDLVCEHYPYKGGLVHKGIMDTARFVLERSGKEIEDALKKFNLTSLYCIGHSLGAGSASLLCSLLQDHFAVYENLEIKAYLFASPPVCTPNLAAEWEQDQIAFVNENDFICRLSYGSALDLKELIKLGALESINPIYEGLSSEEKSKRIMSVLKKAHESLRAVDDIPRLVIGAKIIYLYKALESDPPAKDAKQTKNKISEGMIDAKTPLNFSPNPNLISTSPNGNTAMEPIVTPKIGVRSSSLPKNATALEHDHHKPTFGKPIRFESAPNARSQAVQDALKENGTKSQESQDGLSRKNSANSAPGKEKESTTEDKAKKGPSKKKEIRIEYSDREHFTSIPLRSNWFWHHFPQQYDSRLERALGWVQELQQQSEQTAKMPIV
ncbi:hypothetical protein BGX21_009791 [Mortierella sp. AD011]|nr:hypothetical protein BGX21_009791 [Mortierella sp. AD011]